MAYERITVNPAQMGGLPCLRGMRVTVSAVLGQLAAGQSIEDVLADFPYLERRTGWWRCCSPTLTRSPRTLRAAPW